MNKLLHPGGKQLHLRLLENNIINYQSHLTINNLALPSEILLFRILLIISVLMWATLTASIIGAITTLIFGLLIWLGNGILIARLRLEGIEVKPNQMSDLYNQLLSACKKLEIEKIPKLYIVRTEGFLSGLTMRHCSRDFIILHPEILEVFGPQSNEVMFIIGRELGHIKRKHIVKQLCLSPGLFVPLLAPAYLRSCESSCDRYGVFLAENINASVNAMIAISGGKELYKSMNPIAFTEQHLIKRGFFASWYEITSLYPTLSKRIYDLLSINNGKSNTIRVHRSSLAYFLALFSFGKAGTYPLILLLSICIFFGIKFKLDELEKEGKLKTGQAAQYEELIQGGLAELEELGVKNLSLEEALVSIPK